MSAVAKIGFLGHFYEIDVLFLNQPYWVLFAGTVGRLANIADVRT